MFELNQHANILGTGGITGIELPPVFFTEIFGEPFSDDGYKVSGRYTFVNSDAELFVVYDWKATTLYHGENSGAWTPEEYWHNEEFEELHIGGKEGSNPCKFITWLINQYEQFRSRNGENGLINVLRH